MIVHLMPMTAEELEKWRAAAGATQAEMALAMRVPLRTYEDLVKDGRNLKPIHRRAADMAFLQLALMKGDTSFLRPEHKQMVQELARIIDKEPTKNPPQ